jgi:CPA2 family monovalent cation:H+ antiporter-2
LVILIAGLSEQVISASVYNTLMFQAIVTLILTPLLLKFGLRLAERSPPPVHEFALLRPAAPDSVPRAVVVGIGPVGGRISSQLEIKGYDACLIDLNPINLHDFAQQGFRTVVGDATQPAVLRRADVPSCRIVVVTVPRDEDARRVVMAVRELNRDCTLLVRCRYQVSVQLLRARGATDVVSEEGELAERLALWLHHRLT